MNCTKCNNNNTYNCDDGRCILQDLVCDGNNDCTNGEDEENCENKKPESTTIMEMENGTNNSCDIDDPFYCTVDPAFCIDQKQICDGIKHCQNGVDEQNCNNNNNNNSTNNTNNENSCKTMDSPYYCTEDICVQIEIEQVCDGIKDCPNGRDEENCNVSSSFASGTGHQRRKRRENVEIETKTSNNANLNTSHFCAELNLLWPSCHDTHTPNSHSAENCEKHELIWRQKGKWDKISGDRRILNDIIDCPDAVDESLYVMALRYSISYLFFIYYYFYYFIFLFLFKSISSKTGLYRRI